MLTVMGEAIVRGAAKEERLADGEQVDGGSQETARGGNGERHHRQSEAGVCYGRRGLLQTRLPEALKQTHHHHHHHHNHHHHSDQCKLKGEAEKQEYNEEEENEGCEEAQYT
ncbi:hypothetical protein E2C01_015246 [Portunus trituberculatus]|uniref:Uncharacterized protein n=1 Tax=Portunus trituberculatus TaxID=210409 RepID=A0A5B7DMF4_PORTR|nr:hypothetical protein [Portunus trituberculatus]